MTINPNVLFWLTVGCTLCIMELVIPTAFVEFTLGLSALVVAVAALVMPQLPLQIALFLLVSVALALLARRITPPRRARSIEDAAQGTALTAIAPHQTGRILYEGGSWQARCDHPEITIALGEPVYIVSRKGNTLFVLPERSLYEDMDSPGESDRALNATQRHDAK